VAQKIGAPNNPEYAIGAVASDGSVWRNEDSIDILGVDEGYFERERQRKAAAARAKADRYRGGRQAPDLTGKSVLVVDDGLATGATMKTCLRMLGTTDAARIVVAVPVAPPSTVEEVQHLADEVVCLETPGQFMSVGQFYESFGQVSDEEAMRYLDRSGAVTDP
jgi:predicted phosphoribosyltransferase